MIRVMSVSLKHAKHFKSNFSVAFHPLQILLSKTTTIAFLFLFTAGSQTNAAKIIVE